MGPDPLSPTCGGIGPSMQGSAVHVRLPPSDADGERFYEDVCLSTHLQLSPIVKPKRYGTVRYVQYVQYVQYVHDVHDVRYVMHSMYSMYSMYGMYSICTVCTVCAVRRVCEV